MQAIILAGGLGTRLRSVVIDKPKALSPVAENPFLKYVIDFLKEEGIVDFIFSLGFLANQIIDFLDKEYPHLNYKYFIEDEPLGTGGAIKKCIELASEEDVLIVNADTYFDVPLSTMHTFHHFSNADCTIALKKMKKFDRYGSVELGENAAIIIFKEKEALDEGFINGGFVIIKKRPFLNSVMNFPSFFSFEKDFLEKNLKTLQIKGFESKGYFIDIGIPEDFQKAQSYFGIN